MLAVLIVVTGVVVAGSVYMARVSNDVLSASRLSIDYQAAAQAVAQEESLERKYRLEPGPEVLARYDAAAADLVASLGRVAAHGTAADAAGVEQVIAAHLPYLAAVKRLFLAVDQGDTAKALSIDNNEADPLFASIEVAVNDWAVRHEARAVEALDALRRVVRFTTLVTPIVFMVGLAFIALFASILRRVRGQLERQRAREMHDSLHDSLTGLANRALLSDLIEESLRKPTVAGSLIGLLVIDLDHFQQVNNTLGRNVGDGLLAQVGPRLSSVLSDGDVVSRLGGDQFAVMLESIDEINRAVTVAERLNIALAVPFIVEGVDLAVEASIGVTVSEGANDDAAALVQRGEIAMYVAKMEGTSIVAYRPEHDTYSPERLAMFGDIRRALNNNEFVLYYQPKVAPATGAMRGVEALVRWHHPRRGMIMPNDFIPLVEHTALVGPFTRRVVALAVTQLRSWLDAGLRIPIAVNLSARNLLDADLVQDIIDLLDQFQVPTDLLSLEVTESALMTDPGRAIETLHRLHNLGIHIAIDDFGAGFTSLLQLKTLPVTDLKIDAAFVTTMDRDATNALIVSHIIELGHQLGLTIIAEGVETQAVLDLLEADECDLVQGYHLCRPLLPAAIVSFLRAAPHSLPTPPALTAP